MMLSYAGAVSDLLACPFCRELFADGEAASCPDCGVDLKPMNELPPSLEAQAEDALEGIAPKPTEERRLGWNYWGRSRGALLGLSLLGLALFFSTWVDMTKPELARVSAFDLARGRAGWLWGGAVGWFIMIPLVWSRRTVVSMRGVRVICAMFASMTAIEAIMLMVLPPGGSRLVPVEFTWGYGLYASLLVSIAGVIAAIRFGGKLDEAPAPVIVDRAPGAVPDDETVH